MQDFYSNGKLLLTGEYLVLDGAKALAFPTVYGQSLHIEHIDEPKLYWESYSHDDSLWIKAEFKGFIDGRITTEHPDQYTDRLLQILHAAQHLNPDFLKIETGFKVTSKLDFPSNWGLGSSSTLINNIAQWAKVDAFELLGRTFGGSGYDIACAQNDSAITYQLTQEGREIQEVFFNPKFKEHLYFVHLNKKQDSRAAISEYDLNRDKSEESISKINAITDAIIKCQSFEEFRSLLEQHEDILSECLKKSTIKSQYFKDFNGTIKSLGAWGGDFILVVSTVDPSSYFEQKGYHTILNYDSMIRK